MPSGKIVAAALAVALSCGSASAATYRLSVQEVQLCSGPAVDTTCDADIDRTFLSAIYGAIGIRLDFVSPILTFLNEALLTPTTPGPNPLDRMAALFPDPVRNTTYVGYVGVTDLSYIGLAEFNGVFNMNDSERLPNTLDLTEVVAHEIGHNLGAVHALSTPSTIMTTGALVNNGTTTFIPEFTQANADIMRSSSLLAPIPLPASLLLVLTGLAALGLAARSRRAAVVSRT